MIDDDELGERLRRTFTRVAESTPVAPPPVLPEAEPRRLRPTGARPLVLAGLAAAAAIVVALVVSVAVLDEPREGVRSSEGDPATPTTVDEAGRVTARGADGGLTVIATIGPGTGPGLVAVDVRAHDDDGRVTDVEVTGPRLTPVEHQPEECDGRAAGGDVRLGYSTGVTEAGEVDVTVAVGTVSCESDDPDEVMLEVHLPAAERFEGVDGARTPLVSFTGPDGSGRIVVDADGVDGCLAEVLVDWGEPPARTLVDVPPVDQCDGSSSITGAAAQHAYSPGSRRLRVTATTEAPNGTGQVAFMERTVVIE